MCKNFQADKLFYVLFNLITWFYEIHLKFKIKPKIFHNNWKNTL